jgi:hypothetical protein
MRPFRSWLGTINFFLLQFFFVRLYAEGATTEELENNPRYGLMGFVAPFTGWWGSYWPRQPRFMRTFR